MGISVHTPSKLFGRLFFCEGEMCHSIEGQTEAAPWKRENTILFHATAAFTEQQTSNVLYLR